MSILLGVSSTRLPLGVIFSGTALLMCLVSQLLTGVFTNIFFQLFMCHGLENNKFKKPRISHLFQAVGVR